MSVGLLRSLPYVESVFYCLPFVYSALCPPPRFGAVATLILAVYLVHEMIGLFLSYPSVIACF